MPEKLTTGALLSIMRGQHPTDPILQILSHKKIDVAPNKTRYRLLISDGNHQVSNALWSGAPLTTNSIVKLKEYRINDMNSSSKGPTKVLVILGLDTVEVSDEPIGHPVLLTEDVISSAPQKPAQNGNNSHNSSSHNMGVTKPAAPDMNQSLSDARMFSPISALSPYHAHNWVIKARVSNKSQMRSWSNSKGEGKLFSVDLIDESGEIRCTAFRESADKYFDYLQVDKVYYISKCQLKPANKQFNTLKNDYELTIGKETVIEECLTDDGAVPQVKYNFVPISSIADKNVGSIVDILGVCKEVSDIQTFTSKTTNRELQKRDVILIDQSRTSITLTLWGKEAETFEGGNNPVVVVRGARVGEFGGGKTLSTLMSSQLKVNPDIQECHKIKGWFDLEGSKTDVKNLSERTGSGSFQTPWMTLKEVQDKGLGHSERGDYFQTLATILLIRSENALYKACPSADCNKKIVDLENGMYRCEKCNTEYPNFKYRLLLSMNIADFSGNQWVSMFSGEGEKILGKTSQQIGLAMEEDSSAGTAIFQEANFKQFMFKCRAKVETYNDEQRLKIVVVNVDQVENKHYTYFREEITKMTAELNLQ